MFDSLTRSSWQKWDPPLKLFKFLERLPSGSVTLNSVVGLAIDLPSAQERDERFSYLIFKEFGSAVQEGDEFWDKLGFKREELNLKTRFDIAVFPEPIVHPSYYVLIKPNLDRVVKLLLEEDRTDPSLGYLPPEYRWFVLILEEEGVICGLGLILDILLRQCGLTKFITLCKDGTLMSPGPIAYIYTDPKVMLNLERGLLNLFQVLSATATKAFRMREAVKRVKVLDTRKTLPFMRVLQKYATVVGGISTHRWDLSELIMIKDNHKALLGEKLWQVIEELKRCFPMKPIELEVESLDELRKALTVRDIDVIMLDNFTPQEVREALEIISSSIPANDKRVLIEVSGGVNPENIMEYDIEGVDFISSSSVTLGVGALKAKLEVLDNTM